MRRVFGEMMMSAVAVTILVIALAAANDRVRDQLTGRAGPPSSREVVGVMAQVRSNAASLRAIARSETRAHTPLLVFSVAATVLVVFMLRT